MKYRARPYASMTPIEAKITASRAQYIQQIPVVYNNLIKIKTKAFIIYFFTFAELLLGYITTAGIL